MKIGIDLGGTKIEGIAISENGEELLRKRIKTPKGDYNGTVNSVVKIVKYIESCVNEKGSVGVGIPGAVSPKTGMIKNANSTCLIGKNFNKDLEINLNRKVRLANDANCLAVSEAVDGSGADLKLVFAIIIGTGCGAGIAIEKKVHNGPNYIAGEWGHVTLGWMSKEEYPGPTCYCGQRGCNETFISGTGFENEYKKQTGKIKTGLEIVDLLKNGDLSAAKVMELYESRLARAIASVVNVVDPEVIILGGGMSNISRLYETVPDLVQKWTFGKEFSTPIRKATHGDSSGVRGAAWLW